MTISRKRIVNNVSVLMVSQAIGWGLTFLLTIFLPRYLGAENYGTIALSGSLWAVVSNFAVFGMDTYLTREIARDRSRLDLLLSQSIIIRVILFGIGAAILAVYLRFVDYSPLTLQVITISALSCFTSLLIGGLSATVQALERMEILAFGSILSHILITLFSFGAIFLGAGIITIAWIHSLTAVVVLAFYAYSLLRFHPFKFKPSLENIKGFLAVSFSFFLLYIFINLYNQIDIITISLLVNEKGVGIYSVADKLWATLFFIPTIFMTVLFPTFSRLSKEDIDTLSKLFRKAIRLLFWTGTALGLGAVIISDQGVILLYGAEFAKSGAVLAIRAIVTGFTFSNIILGMYLMSIDRQKSWLIVLAIATFSQIPLNILFVPILENMYSNGALGAAMSQMTTELCMTVAGIYLLPKQTLDKGTTGYFLRTILAGLGMVLGSWWLRDAFIAFPIMVGAILFLSLSYVFKLFSGEEWHLVFETITQVTSKVRSRLLRTTG